MFQIDDTDVVSFFQILSNLSQMFSSGIGTGASFGGCWVSLPQSVGGGVLPVSNLSQALYELVSSFVQGSEDVVFFGLVWVWTPLGEKVHPWLEGGGYGDGVELGLDEKPQLVGLLTTGTGEVTIGIGLVGGTKLHLTPV